jgi:hypothetical protein
MQKGARHDFRPDRPGVRRSRWPGYRHPSLAYRGGGWLCLCLDIRIFRHVTESARQSARYGYSMAGVFCVRMAAYALPVHLWVKSRPMPCCQSYGYFRSICGPFKFKPARYGVDMVSIWCRYGVDMRSNPPDMVPALEIKRPFQTPLRPDMARYSRLVAFLLRYGPIPRHHPLHRRLVSWFCLH